MAARFVKKWLLTPFKKEGECADIKFFRYDSPSGQNHSDPECFCIARVAGLLYETHVLSVRKGSEDPALRVRMTPGL